MGNAMNKLYKLNLKFDIEKLKNDFSKLEDRLINKGSSFRFNSRSPGT